MRVSDIVILRRSTETIIIAAAQHPVNSPIPAASANHVAMLLRAHMGQARAMAELRRLWDRYGGGGRRNSTPDTQQLIVLIVEAIAAGRFSAIILPEKPQISSTDPTNKLAATRRRINEAMREQQSAAQTLATTSPSQTPKLDVRKMALGERCHEVLKRCLPLLSGALRAQLLSVLNDPVRLSVLVGTMVVWAGLQAVAVGEVLDGIAFAAVFATALIEGGSIIMTFQALHDGITFMAAFMDKMVSAKSEADLDEAARDLAGVIGALGVQVLMLAAAHGAGKIKTSAVNAARGGRSATLSEAESAEVNERLATKTAQPGASPPKDPPTPAAAPKAPASPAAAAVKDVETPWGPAVQSSAPEALAARAKVENGATLYRLGTTGKSEAAGGQFWALEHPLNPGYAARYGIPPENVGKFDFIETATIKPGTSFVTRPAPGIGDNPGGGIEVVVPSNSVNMKYFVGQ